MKTRYMLRCRLDDKSAWSEPEEFLNRRARNAAASMARVLGGFRTHSYEEKTSAITVPSIAGEASAPAQSAAQK